MPTIMMVWVVIVALLLAVSESFVPPIQSLIPRSSSSSSLYSSSTNINSDTYDVNRKKLSSPAQEQIFDFFQALHSCGYPFRTIVIGSGAILESTQTLGPTFKVSESPKTGNLILTMASQDQSFEFHVKLEQVHKIALVERQQESGKVLRIIRMTNEKEESICSLILAEYSEGAATFFQDLVTKYGDEFLPYDS